MKEIIESIVVKIDEVIPPNHGFCTIVVPMDKAKATQIGVASTLETSQLLEVFKGLIARMEAKPLKMVTKEMKEINPDALKN